MKNIKLYFKIFNSLLLVGLLLCSVSCSDDSHASIPNENEIVEFTITVNGEQKTGVKSELGDTITFKMTPGFDTSSLEGLSPAIYISGYATISPMTSVVQDFNEPVKYNVTANDGSVREWIIKWT